LGCDQLSFFGGALQDGAAYRSANLGGFQLRIGECHLSLGLQQRPTSVLDLFGAWADLSKRVRLFQRLHVLERSIVAGLGIVELLPRYDALFRKRLGAIEGDFGVAEIRPGLIKVRRRLLNLFRTRAVLELLQARIGGSYGAARLQHLGAELLVFQFDEHLPGFYLVAL